MIPELGKYAGAVLSSYGLSIGLILLLVAASVRRSWRVKAELEDVEMRRKSDG